MSLARKSTEVFIFKWLLSPLDLLMSVLVVRVIGVEGQGILTLLLATVSVLATIGSLGVPAAAIYYLQKRIHNQRMLIANFLFFITVFSLFVCGLFFLYKEWFIRFFFENVSINPWLIGLALCSLPITMLTGLISGIQLGSGLSRPYNQLVLTTSLINLVATFLLIVVFPFGITGVIVASLLAAAIPLVVAFIQIDRSTRGSAWKISWSVLSDLLHYGIRHYSATISSMTFNRIGNFILAYFVNVRAVGYYSVAVSGYNAILSIPRSLNTLLFGETATLEKSKSALLVAKSTRNIFSVMLCATIPLAVISPWLIPLLYGANFAQAVIPLIILLVASLLLGVYATIQTYFSGINRPGFNSTISFISCVVSVIFALLLVPIAGITGMAIASLLAHFFAFLLCLSLFRHLTGIAIRPVLVPTKQDIAGWHRQMKSGIQRMHLVLKLRQDG